MELVFGMDRQRFSIRQSFKAFLNDFVWHLHFHFIPHHTNNYHPHILSHRMTGLLAGLLLSVKIFSLGLLTFSPAIPAFSSAITEENIILLTNHTREEFNLTKLKFSSPLAQAAQAKANDMAEKGYFAHTSPDGRLPWDFMKAEGYEYIMAGENLAVNFLEAESVENAWMNSPTHKANIINKNYEEIGIGIAQGNYGNRQSIFVVQMFGVPSEQTIALQTEPTKVETQNPPLPKVQTKLLAEALVIKDVKVNIVGSDAVIQALVSPNATKVLAVYGQKAVRLSPAKDNSWQASVPLVNLMATNKQLVISAYNLAGQRVQQTVAGFSNDLVNNYNFSTATGAVAGKTVSAFGRSVNLGDFEHKFYLLFVAGILTCLILAIGIKRHIQHIGMVANGSFVAILAMLLWMG